MRGQKVSKHFSEGPSDSEQKEERGEPDVQEEEMEGVEGPQDTDDDDNRFYCFCRKKAGKGRMIQCDQCKEWYHLRCLRMIAKTADETASYVCRTCKESSKKETEDEKKIDFNSVLNGLDSTRKTAIKG